MMKHFGRTAAAFAATGFLAGMALVGGLGGPAAAGDRDAASRIVPRCLDSHDMGRRHVVDDHTLLIYDNAGNPYKLGIGGPCRNMNDYSKIGFEYDGSDEICGAHDAKVLYSEFDEPPVTCIINSFEAVSRDEARALDKE